MQNATKKIAVIGAGSWGTTIAKHLAEKDFRVFLWTREEEVKKSIGRSRENSLFLPGIKLPEHIRPSNDIGETLHDAPYVVFSVPSQYIRKILAQSLPFLARDSLTLNTAKGLELTSAKCMGEIFTEILPKNISRKYASLSGPSFAKEVANQKPTAVAIASRNKDVAEQWATIFSNEYFGVHITDDVRGIEIAGALKNVVAIAVGIARGLALGYNAEASLITAGLEEIAAIGTKMGANPITFLGPAGVGDLTLTCTGDLSRNREVGVRIGKGESPQSIFSHMHMIAEGAATSLAAKKLARKVGARMPIAEQVHAILYMKKSPRKAIIELITERINPKQRRQSLYFGKTPYDKFLGGKMK